MGSSESGKSALSIAESNLRTLRVPLILYGLIAGAALAYQPGSLVWYSFHPFCMTFSFVTLSGLSVLYKKVGGAANTRLHGYLMLAATALALFAGYVIYSNKEMKSKSHLTTYHGKIGAAVLLGYIGLGLVGYFALSPEWGALRTYTPLRTVHKYSGRVLILLSWVAMMLHVCSMYAENVLAQAAFGFPLVVFAYYILL